MLMEHRIDLSAIGCTQTQPRSEVVDFVTPTRRNLFTLLTATTTKPKLNVLAYLEVCAKG